MARHRWGALLCAFVVLDAVVLAVFFSAWALAIVPFAVVFGLAAWKGIAPGKTLDALGDSSSDAGSGPAGLTP